MKRSLAIAALAFGLALPATAQEADEPVTPASVVASASAEEWVTISPEDLLVMELAPDARGNSRTVVIQLASAPFSQPWVENIRTLARAHWWNGTSVYRVQDNYVSQWGDATEEKALPEGVTSPQDSYGTLIDQFDRDLEDSSFGRTTDNYASHTGFLDGWPVAGSFGKALIDGALSETVDLIAWPIHCYGYIGVARDYAPDTGTGAELYTIIGQPQRHMDRNLAVVGRVIAGMEHLSSLPRGSGELGFYNEDEVDLRTPILSVRLASEMAVPPSYEYLATDSETFARYVAVRANRNDAFYTQPAGGVDVCSVQVPVRPAAD